MDGSECGGVTLGPDALRALTPFDRAPTAANPNPPYDVVDRRGALVARVATGKDVEVIGFGRAAVYTAATDDDGIRHVQRRPLPKF